MKIVHWHVEDARTQTRDFPKGTKLNKKIVLQCPAAYKIIDLYFKPDTNDL